MHVIIYIKWTDASQVDIEIYVDKLGQSRDRILSSHITIIVIRVYASLYLPLLNEINVFSRN